MTNRLFLAAFTLLAVSACTDGPMGNAPLVPPPTHGTPLGMIRGTVSGKTMTAEFVPMGANAAVGKSSAISPSIYGSTSTISVVGEFVSLVDNSPVPGLRTWTFNVHMQNLLSFPIGSNYSASNSTPVDTSGVFIGFTTLPIVTATPGCPGLGCTVNVGNWSGKQAFTAPNQEFFWYQDRPTAFGGLTDTTRNLPWKFIGTFDPPSGDTANTFIFALMVSAAWPPPNDTAWAYLYSGATDSLPDQFAKPRWKPPFTQVNQYTTLGSETFNQGTDLVLTAATGTSSILIARNDSTDSLRSASIVVQASLQNAIVGSPIQAVFGLVQPGTIGSQAIVGIYDDHVAFVQVDPVTGLWSTVPGTISVPVVGTGSHTYRIGKFGSLNLYLLCVDNNTKAFLTPAQAQVRSPDFATTTEFFGAIGNATGPANVHVTNVAYALGIFNGGC